MEKALQSKIKALSQVQSDTDRVIDLWKERFLKTDGGLPRSNSSRNVVLILQNDPRLKDLLQYNEFAERIEIKKNNDYFERKNKRSFTPEQWDDSDDSKLKLFIEDNYNYVPSKDAISDAIVKFAMEHGYNPVKQRIESVKWDGVNRVETFFMDYLGTEDSYYVRAITKRWLTGIVARVYQPGIKFEIVPILFGGQGIGKSTLVGSIYPDYFLDELQTMGKTKDDFQQLQGKWIVELGELSAMRRTDVDNVKKFISAQQDNYRPSYGRYATDHPRKIAFVGTSNPPEFLKDKTGNRRFFPIECVVQDKKKDPFKIDDADILQVLAEAKVMYDNGDEIHVDAELQEVADKYQKNAMVQDPTEEQILSFLDMPIPKNWQEYNTDNRRNYFVRYVKGEGCINKDSLKQLKETVTMDQVTTNEILLVAFNIIDDQLLSASRGNVGKQVSDIMNGLDNWQRSTNVRISKNKRGRGYKRK